jgi:hypothetical protein
MFAEHQKWRHTFVPLGYIPEEEVIGRMFVQMGCNCCSYEIKARNFPEDLPGFEGF